MRREAVVMPRDAGACTRRPRCSGAARTHLLLFAPWFAAQNMQPRRTPRAAEASRGCTAALPDTVRVCHFLPHPVSGLHHRPGELAGLPRIPLAAHARRVVARPVLLLAE